MQMTPTERSPSRPLQWQAGVLLLLGAGVCAPAHPADPPQFEGRVVLEVLDSVELDHKLRLLEEFSFRDENGRLWLAPAGAVIDGTSLPRMLRSAPDLPPETQFRRASVVHDYYSSTRQETWREVRRMLYGASLHEGLSPWRRSCCMRRCTRAAGDGSAHELLPQLPCRGRHAGLQPDLEQAEFGRRRLLRDRSHSEEIERVDAVTTRPTPSVAQVTEIARRSAASCAFGAERP